MMLRFQLSLKLRQWSGDCEEEQEMTQIKKPAKNAQVTV